MSRIRRGGSAPLLKTTSPADNATDVPVNSNLVLMFNEGVKAGSGSIKIYASDGSLFHSIAATDASQVTFASNVVTINPSADFNPGTAYYVLVDPGAILDSSGNGFAGISSPTAFNIATAGPPPPDIAPPQLTGTSPVDAATNVISPVNLILTFNEAVKAGSGTIDIHNASDASIAESIPIGDVGEVGFSGNQATIHPATPLTPGGNYYVTVAPGAILDLADNPFTGIASPDTFHFNLAAPLPLLKSGPEFLVNTITDGQQYNASVAGLSDGQFVVVWQDSTHSFSAHGQIFAGNGSKIGPAFQVNATTDGGWQIEPTVAALPDGGFAVAWESTGDGSTYDVNAQLFAPDGTKVGSEFVVNSSPAGSEIDPAIAELSNGNFVVVWEDGSGTLASNIHGQIFDSDGNRVGTEFAANGAVGVFPTVAALSGGGFVLGWTAQYPSGGDAAADFQMFDGMGNDIGAVVTVSSGSESAAVSWADAAMVQGLASGGFVYLWKEMDTPTFSLHGQVFDSDGSPSSSEFLVTNEAVSDADSTAHKYIASLADGRFVVAWSDGSGTMGGEPVAVHGQIFNLDGTKSGSEFLVNAPAEWALRPAVGVLPDGNVVMAWTVLSEDPSDTSSGDVHAQIFSFSPAVPGLTLTGNGLANVLTGGADNDTIAGLGGRDTLTGGGGADTFVYSAVTDSTSRSYDTIRDFDPSADSFHLWYQISGVDPEIDAGSLGSRRFDSNLASAVGNSHLAPHHAVLFTPSSGTYAGQSFLVVDANGVAGYQAGADLVIHLGANSSHLGSLSVADFF